MKKILLFIVFIGLGHLTFSQKVRLIYDKSLPQAIYTAGALEKMLLKQGYLLKESQAEYEISISLNAGKLKREGYSIFREGKKITINGGDERGLIYGGLSLADDLKKM